jgi:hypothetical protein
MGGALRPPCDERDWLLLRAIQKSEDHGRLRGRC